MGLRKKRQNIKVVKVTETPKIRNYFACFPAVLNLQKKKKPTEVKLFLLPRAAEIKNLPI